MPTVVAANIPHTLGPRAALHDAELAFRMAGPDGVVCGCEIDAGNDGPFEDAAHPTHRVRFRARKTQVAVPSSWRNIESHRYRVTRPPRLWTNPGRDLNVVFNHNRREFYAAMHAPNRRLGRAFARLAVRKNARYHAKVATIVGRLLEAGWSGVIAGDGNDTRVYHYAPGRQVVAAHAGLMWVVAFPAYGKTVRVRDVRVNRSNKGDHPVVSAEVEFRKGPA